jgi:hypothetical protein
VAYEKFDINIISNKLRYHGLSGICDSNSCYQTIDTNTIGITTYWDCGIGDCVNPNT